MTKSMTKSMSKPGPNQYRSTGSNHDGGNYYQCLRCHQHLCGPEMDPDEYNSEYRPPWRFCYACGTCWDGMAACKPPGWRRSLYYDVILAGNIKRASMPYRVVVERKSAWLPESVWEESEGYGCQITINTTSMIENDNYRMIRLLCECRELRESGWHARVAIKRPGKPTHYLGNPDSWRPTDE